MSKRDANSLVSSIDKRSSFIGVSRTSSVSYLQKEDVKRRSQKAIEKQEEKMLALGLLKDDENIEGMIKEQGIPPSFQEVIEDIEARKDQVEVDKNMYACIEHFAQVHTKYKTVDKKVRPAAVPLPWEAEEILRRAKEEPSLRDRAKIGHKFTKETLDKLKVGDGFLSTEEQKAFKKMVIKNEKAFAFSIEEIGCADPKEITPMVIFTVPHVPWDLKPISVPRALMPKLVELLKEKLDAKILERSNAPYSNRWFTVRKKNGKLRFIQDMQPPNKVTIRNVGTGPIVDEFAEEFAGRAIYSIGDLYSGYDQFQLAQDSRDITTLRTPLGLLRMCTLPMGATNSVAHMQNAMNRVLQPFIPEKTRPFLDDIPIKGCLYKARDQTIRPDGMRQFVWEHLQDVEAILQRLIEVGLTLSLEKSSFGLEEIMVVGQICGPLGRRPSEAKVDVIKEMKDCRTISEVRRFLGACIFYRMWIVHFAHIADPLYGLLRKNVRFVWTAVHAKAMQLLKEALISPPILRPLRYGDLFPIIITVDSSPHASGWAIGQDDEEGNRFAARFGAKVFTERQRRYPQVKRELWGAKIALHQERDYLIGAYVILETDCKPLLGMIANCDTPDIAMLRWIAFIRMFNPELKHIAGKDNPVADMLSRARYTCDDHEDRHAMCLSSMVEEASEEIEFNEELYCGELLQLGRYLSSLQRDPQWSNEDFSKIRKKSHQFMVKNGVLWKHPKKKGFSYLRVIGKKEEKQQILQQFHDSDMAGHKGREASYEGIRRMYWWPGMYVDVKEYVETCKVCQLYSKVKHRDGLNPTYPLSLHYQWALDVVHMPKGVRGAKFLVLAIEDLSSYIEGRALTTNKTEAVCRFVLEDIVARYGCFNRMRADNGELNAEEATTFFKKFNVRLKLTTAYNPEGNGKSERGHQPIVNALVKACKGKISLWPTLLPLALMAHRVTSSSVTGYAPAELINGQLPLMPIEDNIASWRTIEWRDNIPREELLLRRIEHFDQTPAKVEEAIQELKKKRMANKERFDKTHRLRPKPVREGDWVLIAEGNIGQDHATVKKFAQRWRGPFVVVTIHSNSTYTVRELDGAIHRVPYAGKRVKIFKRRVDFADEDILDSDYEEEDLEDISQISRGE